MASGSNSKERAAHCPLYDIISIEVLYTDRTLETFGMGGAGWFWWPRRRGYPPDGSPTRPFATSYSAYRHAMNSGGAGRNAV
jgi:hypothetical protein